MGELQWGSWVVILLSSRYAWRVDGPAVSQWKFTWKLWRRYCYSLTVPLLLSLFSIWVLCFLVVYCVLCNARCLLVFRLVFGFSLWVLVPFASSFSFSLCLGGDFSRCSHCQYDVPFHSVSVSVDGVECCSCLSSLSCCVCRLRLDTPFVRVPHFSWQLVSMGSFYNKLSGDVHYWVHFCHSKKLGIVFANLLDWIFWATSCVSCVSVVDVCM